MRETGRSVALTALLDMDESEGYSNIIIDKALKNCALEKRDSALAAAIFYGVLEKRLTLDHLISRCLENPRKKLDKTVEMILRCAGYQLFYMDKIPPSACVNEAVELAKERGLGKLSSFVNGVLRTMLRNKESLSLPAGEDLEALCLRYSVPQELIALWQKAYGKEITLRILEAFLERAPVTLRVQSMRTTVEQLSKELEEQEISLTPIPDFPFAASLSQSGSPVALPQFQQGLFHVQDLSAQFVCQVLRPQPGEVIWDVCAAPGGKTFTLAEDMGDTGMVYAFDLYKGRVKLIEEGAARLGLTSIRCERNDALAGFPELPQADRILCDVPCSGYGVIRRKPEIRYKPISSVEDLPEIQYRILSQAAAHVKSGGMLLYSTCTLHPAENNRVAERFLQSHGEAYVPYAIPLPPSFSRAVEEPTHMLTMMPFSGASDGFFLAAFQKR